MIMAKEGTVLLKGESIQLCAELCEIIVGMRENMPDVFVNECIKLAFDEDVKKDADIKLMDAVFKDIPVVRTDDKEPSGLDAFFKAMHKVKGDMEHGN